MSVQKNQQSTVWLWSPCRSCVPVSKISISRDRTDDNCVSSDQTRLFLLPTSRRHCTTIRPAVDLSTEIFSGCFTKYPFRRCSTHSTCFHYLLRFCIFFAHFWNPESYRNPLRTALPAGESTSTSVPSTLPAMQASTHPLCCTGRRIWFKLP